MDSHREAQANRPAHARGNSRCTRDDIGRGAHQALTTTAGTTDRCAYGGNDRGSSFPSDTNRLPNSIRQKSMRPVNDPSARPRGEPRTAALATAAGFALPSTLDREPHRVAKGRRITAVAADARGPRRTRPSDRWCECCSYNTLVAYPPT